MTNLSDTTTKFNGRTINGCTLTTKVDEKYGYVDVLVEREQGEQPLRCESFRYFVEGSTPLDKFEVEVVEYASFVQPATAIAKYIECSEQAVAAESLKSRRTNKCEVARLRHQLKNETYWSDGALCWQSSKRPVPVDCFRDALVEAPEGQQEGCDREAAKSIASYRAQRAKTGYSPEEIFEMQAAFGPGAEVVDIFTNAKIKL